MKKHYIIPIFVPHQGCPHTCVFCSQTEITGEENDMTGDRVQQIIAEYLQTIPQDRYVEVGFFGGSFTGIPLKKQEELLAPAYEARQKGQIQSIRLSTRPDYINEAILDHLSQYGVGTVEIGAQSFSDEVLRISERGHTAEQIQRSAKLVRQKGFKLGIQLMVGLPEDTYQRWIMSVGNAVQLKPDLVRIYPTLVLADTVLADLMEHGEYTPLSLTDAVNWCRDGLALFRQASVPVIRIGLQPTEEISPQAKVLAGPYHPAIRQLVESSLILCLIEEALQSYVFAAEADPFLIGVPVQTESDYRGQKNSNLNYLQAHFPGQEVRMIRDESLEKDEFWIAHNQQKNLFRAGDLLDRWLKGRQLFKGMIQWL